MISKKKIAAGLAIVASTFLLAGTSLTAGPASAAGHATCAVTGGTVTIDGGGGITLQGAQDDHFSFVGFTINCVSPDNPAANGNWKINASGNSTAETCASGSGTGSITSGTSPGEGLVTGGSFSFTRVGAAVVVSGGTVTTSGGGTHSFSAALAFTPSDGECSGTGTGPTKHAGINGAAVVA